MKTYSDVVHEVLKLKNMEILLEERRFFSCLTDLSEGEFQRENKLISRSFDKNMMKTLYDAGNAGASQLDLAEKKVIYLLGEEAGMAEKTAADLTLELSKGIRAYRGLPASKNLTPVSSGKNSNSSGKPATGTKAVEPGKKAVEPGKKAVEPGKKAVEPGKKTAFGRIHVHTVQEKQIAQTMKCTFLYDTCTLTLDGCRSAIAIYLDENPGEGEHLIPLHLVKKIVTGDSVELLKLNSKKLCTLKSVPALERVLLGKGMKQLSGIINPILAYEVAAGHPSWCAIDGVVYTKDKKELIAFPNARTGSYTIPDTVERIHEEAFYHSRLSQILFSKNLLSIGKDAFCGCGGLTALSFPDRLETLGKDAFSGCTGLHALQLPAHLTEIPPGAFRGCTNLQEIRFGNGTRKIGEFAFSDCKKLERLELPQTVEAVGLHAFTNCIALKKLSIPDTPALEILDAMPWLDAAGSSFNMTPHSYDTIDFHGRRDFSKIKDKALREFAGRCVKCGGEYSLFGTCKTCKAKRPKK